MIICYLIIFSPNSFSSSPLFYFSPPFFSFDERGAGDIQLNLSSHVVSLFLFIFILHLHLHLLCRHPSFLLYFYHDLHQFLLLTPLYLPFFTLHLLFSLLFSSLYLIYIFVIIFVHSGLRLRQWT